MQNTFSIDLLYLSGNVALIVPALHLTHSAMHAGEEAGAGAKVTHEKERH